MQTLSNKPRSFHKLLGLPRNSWVLTVWRLSRSSRQSLRCRNSPAVLPQNISPGVPAAGLTSSWEEKHKSTGVNRPHFQPSLAFHKCELTHRQTWHAAIAVIAVITILCSTPLPSPSGNHPEYHHLQATPKLHRQAAARVCVTLTKVVQRLDNLFLTNKLFSSSGLTGNFTNPSYQTIFLPKIRPKADPNLLFLELNKTWSKQIIPTFSTATFIWTKCTFKKVIK